VTQCNVVLLRVKWLENGKAKDIEGYQDEIFTIEGSTPIPHIHNIFNLVVKHGFPKPWMQILIVHIFKMGIETFPLIIGPL
jgi:hypothetical protein